MLVENFQTSAKVRPRVFTRAGGSFSLCLKQAIKGAIKYEMPSPSPIDDEDGPLLDCYVEIFAETVRGLGSH